MTFSNCLKVKMPCLSSFNSYFSSSVSLFLIYISQSFNFFRCRAVTTFKCIISVKSNYSFFQRSKSALCLLKLDSWLRVIQRLKNSGFLTVPISDLRISTCTCATQSKPNKLKSVTISNHQYYWDTNPATHSNDLPANILVQEYHKRNGNDPPLLIGFDMKLERTEQIL